MQNLFNGEDETRSGLDELTPWPVFVCVRVCMCACERMRERGREEEEGCPAQQDAAPQSEL